MSAWEARNLYSNAVFIECRFKNSAWGFGRVDYYDYIGYKRNERFFLLKDYVEISGNNLLNALANFKVALVGDIYLCQRLYEYLKQNRIGVTDLSDTYAQSNSQRCLTEVMEDDDEEILYLLVVPELSGPDRQKWIEKLKQMKEFLKRLGIDNYTDYFSFINVEEKNEIKYRQKWMRPKKIVLGSIESHSGNVFFRGLLDSHPAVLMMDGNVLLNRDLFWLCVRLSVEEASNILPMFWKIYEQETREQKSAVHGISDQSAFDQRMKQLLSRSSKFTSQELFVMFHLGFAYMYGYDIDEANIINTVIFWEPHGVIRTNLESCVRWLGTEDVACDIINIVRNACKRSSSRLKATISANRIRNRKWAYDLILNSENIDKKDWEHSERAVVRFEDLKCNPKEELLNICNKWGIAWSDSLMMTTCHGKRDFYDNGEGAVSDFDLRPLYDEDEEYLSEFDRFRIMIAAGPRQRKYGYPYIRVSEFSRRQLQEIFSSKFRFERLLKCDCYDIESDLGIQNTIRAVLQKARLSEFLNQ